MNMVQVYFMREEGTVPVCHLETFVLVSCIEQAAFSLWVPDPAGTLFSSRESEKYIENISLFNNSQLNFNFVLPCIIV